MVQTSKQSTDAVSHVVRKALPAIEVADLRWRNASKHRHAFLTRAANTPQAWRAMREDEEHRIRRAKHALNGR